VNTAQHRPLAARVPRRIIGRRLSSPRTTLGSTFQTLRAANRIGLLPFVPAGYPNLETTATTIVELERGGASAIEVGFPFSDPIADGPIIQQAFTEALASGVRVADVFRTVAETRPQVSLPLVAMVSFSIVYRYGVGRFVEHAHASGFDALIIPDLPPPEAEEFAGVIRGGGLDTVMLVAPSTPPDRRAHVVRLCSGFVYYLAVAGTTGERSQLPSDLVENVKQLRAAGDCPVCVGFGISRAEHVRLLHGTADGAIVGSAVVRRMMRHRSDKPNVIAREAGEICRELLSQVS
jgi:tryptophan synthase alpha chain